MDDLAVRHCDRRPLRGLLLVNVEQEEGSRRGVHVLELKGVSSQKDDRLAVGGREGTYMGEGDARSTHAVGHVVQADQVRNSMSGGQTGGLRLIFRSGEAPPEGSMEEELNAAVG